MAANSRERRSLSSALSERGRASVYAWNEEKKRDLRCVRICLRSIECGCC